MKSETRPQLSSLNDTTDRWLSISPGRLQQGEHGPHSALEVAAVPHSAEPPVSVWWRATAPAPPEDTGQLHLAPAIDRHDNMKLSHFFGAVCWSLKVGSMYRSSAAQPSPTPIFLHLTLTLYWGLPYWVSSSPFLSQVSNHVSLATGGWALGPSVCVPVPSRVTPSLDWAPWSLR